MPDFITTGRIKSMNQQQYTPSQTKTDRIASMLGPVNTTVTTSTGKQYTLDDKQYNWIQNRYKSKMADTYGYDDADQLAKRNGQLSAAALKTYKNTNVDRQLAELGLPSEKELGKYLEDYSRWHTGGMDQVFGQMNLPKDYWTKTKGFYQADMQKAYENTAEDQQRKARGLMPEKWEAKYTDTEIDEQLRARGLPPISEFGTYAERWNNYQGIENFYANVARNETNLRLAGIKDDDTVYPYNGEEYKGKDLYAMAFYDELDKVNDDGSFVYGSIRPLFKNSSSKEPTSTGDYLYDRGAAVLAENKNAVSADDYDSYNAFSYDDYKSKYPELYERYFANQQTESGQTVSEALAVKQREEDEEATREYYTIGKEPEAAEAFAHQYAADYPDATPEQMFLDMEKNNVPDTEAYKVYETMKKEAAGTDKWYDIVNGWTKTYGGVWSKVNDSDAPIPDVSKPLTDEQHDAQVEKDLVKAAQQYGQALVTGDNDALYFASERVKALGFNNQEALVESLKAGKSDQFVQAVKDAITVYESAMAAYEDTAGPGAPSEASREPINKADEALRALGFKSIHDAIRYVGGEKEAMSPGKWVAQEGEKADSYVQSKKDAYANDADTINDTTNTIQSTVARLIDKNDELGKQLDVDTLLSVIDSISDKSSTNPTAMRLALTDLGFLGDELSGWAGDITEGWSDADKRKLNYYLGGNNFTSMTAGEGGANNDWSEAGSSTYSRQLKSEDFSLYLEYALQQVNAGNMTEADAYNLLAAKGYQEEMDAYMPEEWHKAHFIENTAPGLWDQSREEDRLLWEEMTPEEQRAASETLWNDLTPEQKSAMYEKGWWKFDPSVYRTFGQALEQQFQAVLPGLGAEIISTPVKVLDAIEAGISGRPEMWETTQNLMEFQQRMGQLGAVTDNVNGAQVAQTAADVVQEIGRMYYYGSIGGAIGGAFAGTSAGAAVMSGAASSSKVVRGASKMFMSMVKSSPFMVSAFANNYSEVKALGASNSEATWFGLITGLTEGILEGFEFDELWGKALGQKNFAELLTAGKHTYLERLGIIGKSWISSAAVSGLGEFTEESIGYVLETFLKMRHSDTWGKGTEWSTEDWLQQAMMGFITGALGGGIAAGGTWVADGVKLTNAMKNNPQLQAALPDVLAYNGEADSMPKATLDAYRKGGATALSRSAYDQLITEIENNNKGIENYTNTIEAIEAKRQKAIGDAQLEVDKLAAKIAPYSTPDASGNIPVLPAEVYDKEFAPLVVKYKAAVDHLDYVTKNEDPEAAKQLKEAKSKLQNALTQKESLAKREQEHWAALYLMNEHLHDILSDEMLDNLAKAYQNGAKYEPEVVRERTKADASPLENVNDPTSPWWSKQKEADAKPARAFSQEDERAVVEAAGKMRYKGKISFVDDPEANWEGKINVKTGDITINRSALTSRDAQRIQDNPAMWVLEHELWHYIWNRSGGTANDLANTVRKMYEQHPALARGNTEANWNKLLDGVIQKRNSQGLTIETREQAAEEVIGDFFRNYAFRSQEAINALCQTNGNLGERILSWLRYKIDDMKLRRSKDSWARDLLKVERQYALALREAGRNPYNAGRAQANSDVTYSVKRTADNKPFIEIEEDILAGVPEDQWKTTVFNYIRQKFKGGFDANGQHIDVTRNSAKEFARSKYSNWLERNDRETYADKLRASAYLDEITAASPDYVNEDLHHDRDGNITSFGRGNIRFRFGTNDYISEVLIGNRDDGSLVFHDVVNVTPTSFTEKQTKQSPELGDISAATNSLGTASGDNIPSATESVKMGEKESAAGNLTDDLLNGYVGQANPNTGVTAEEDEAYMRAALAGDTETAGRMVRDMYERNGLMHVYRGEPKATGSWTQVNMDNFKGPSSGMFAATDIDTARAAEYTHSYAREDLKTKPLSYGDEMPVLQQFADGVAQRIGRGLNLVAKSYYMDDEGNTFAEDGKGREHHWALRDADTGDIFADSTELTTLADAAKRKAARLIGGNPQNIYNSIDDPFAGRILDLFVKFDNANEHNARGDEWDKIQLNSPKGVTLYRIEVTYDPENESMTTVTAYPIDESFDAESSSASERETKSITFEADDMDYMYKLEKAFKDMFGPKSDVAEFFMDYADWNEDGATLDKVGVRDKNGRYVSPELFPDAETTSTDELAVRDKAAGYDGSIIRNVRDGGSRTTTDTVSFNPNYIKSADAITYDDDGNIIPLSQRGDFERNELRYSGDLDIDQILNNMVDEYGAIEPGRNPRARDVQVPRQTNDMNRVSQWIRSLIESGKLTDDQAQNVLQMVVEQDYGTYVPTSQAERMEEARAYIAERQPLQAQQEFHDMVMQGKYGVKTNALGIQLLSDASARGDIASVLDIAADLQLAATEAGQSAQIFNVLKELKGVGSAWYMQKVIDRMNAKYADRIAAGKMNRISVDPALMADLAKATTVDQMAAAEEAVAKDIARQLPLTWDDRLSSWRYFSMLANPTTHIRNITGNLLMKGLNTAKDAVATGLENILGVDQSDRAHAILTQADKNTWGGWAQRSYEEQARNLQGGGKLGFETFIKQNTRSFDTKFLDALAKFNFNALEGEDIAFIKPAYKNALMQYMKAQGYTLNENGVAGKTNAKGEFVEMTKAQQNAAIDWASQQAWKQTFRDASSLATMLNKISKENAVSRLLVEGVMPFKKTPINIAKRGVDYSLAGVIKGIAQLTIGVKKGKVTTAQAIDTLASGITGSALMALGVMLAKLGVIRAGGEKDKKLETYLEDTGDQTYAMKFGDKSINMSSIAPATIPLFMGVALNEMIEQGGDSLDLSTITDTIAGTLNPFMEMSFMSSLNSALKNYNTNGIGGALGSTIMTAAQNYGSQYLPTLGGKVAQFLDPTRRTTKSDATSPVGGNLDYYWRSLVKKVPGAEATLQPDVDIWGRTDTKDSFGDWALDFANKFILPTNIKVTNRDAVDNELIRVVESTGVTDFLPSDGNKYFTVNKQKYQMNARQYTQYSQERGQAAYAALKDTMASASYKMASDEQKASMLKKALDAAYKQVSNQWKEKLGAYDNK